MIAAAIATGVCLSNGLCHFALGIRRPRRAKNLLFAAMMAVICPFQLVVGAFNSTTSLERAIPLARYGAALAIVFMVVFAAFVREYARVVVHRALVYGFLSASAAWLVYDLVAPRGILFTSLAEVRESLGMFDRVPVGGVELAWHAFNAATALWAAKAGWTMARRGRHRSGMALVLGVSACLVTVLIDAVRDLLGRAWPYLGGYGAMVLAMLLAIELALDFRDKEVLLAKYRDDTIRIRDQLNTPLQVLRLALELAGEVGEVPPEHIAPLGRAVDRLNVLGESLRAAAVDPRAPAKDRQAPA
jgi:hypothetical protein